MQMFYIILIWLGILLVTGCNHSPTTSPQHSSNVETTEIGKKQTDTKTEEYKPQQKKTPLPTEPADDTDSEQEYWNQQCTAKFSKTKSTAAKLHGWKSVAKQIIEDLKTKGYENELPSVSNDIEGRTMLFSDNNFVSDVPQLVTIGELPIAFTFLIVPLENNDFWVTSALTENWGGRCPDESTNRIIEDNPVHVASVSFINDWVFFEEGDNEYSGCLWDHQMVVHHFLDIHTGAIVSIAARIDGLDDVNPFPPEQLIEVIRNGQLVRIVGCGTQDEFTF